VAVVVRATLAVQAATAATVLSGTPHTAQVEAAVLVSAPLPTLATAVSLVAVLVDATRALGAKVSS
jgi:hypothetical protein